MDNKRFANFIDMEFKFCDKLFDFEKLLREDTLVPFREFESKGNIKKCIKSLYSDSPKVILTCNDTISQFKELLKAEKVMDKEYLDMKSEYFTDNIAFKYHNYRHMKIIEVSKLIKQMKTELLSTDKFNSKLYMQIVVGMSYYVSQLCLFSERFFMEVISKFQYTDMMTDELIDKCSAYRSSFNKIAEKDQSLFIKYTENLMKVMANEKDAEFKSYTELEEYERKQRMDAKKASNPKKINRHPKRDNKKIYKKGSKPNMGKKNNNSKFKKKFNSDNTKFKNTYSRNFSSKDKHQSFSKSRDRG